MALSDVAWEFLGALAVDVPKNGPALLAGLGGRSVLEELVDIGHLEQRGGRYARTALSSHAYQLFDALPTDGTSIGNGNARQKSGLTKSRYDAAKAILLKSAEIARGRGQGGSVRRIVSVEVGSRTGHVDRESDLYEPFRTWLKDGRPHSLGQAFVDHHITAHGRQQRRSTGQWSRPDVVTIEVTNHPMLPGATVMVSAYEIKRYSQATDLAGVYEASAHQRRAHYASLVIEWPDVEDHEPPSNIKTECERLGVGLLRMWGDQVEELVDPAPKLPAPEDLNEFITDVILKSRLPDYLTAIGRPGELDEI